MRRWGDIDAFLSREDVEAGDIGLGVSVLARLGGRDLDDLAGLALEHDDHALLHLTSADGVRLGGVVAGLFKLFVSHFVVLLLCAKICKSRKYVF